MRFTSMDHWAKRLFVGFKKDGIHPYILFTNVCVSQPLRQRPLHLGTWFLAGWQILNAKEEFFINQGQRSKVKVIIMKNVFFSIINGFFCMENILLIVGTMPIFIGRLPTFGYQLKEHWNQQVADPGSMPVSIGTLPKGTNQCWVINKISRS